MEEIATASVDFILTSPPYWNLVDYKHPNQIGNNVSYKHYLHQLKKTLLECMRVIKEDSMICLVVGDIRTGKYKQTGRPRLYSIQSSIIQFFTEEMDFDLFQHFIWEKYGVKKGEKSSLIYGSVCRGKYKDFGVPPFLYTDLLSEHILVFRKPGIRERPPIEERQKDNLNLISKDELNTWLKPIWKINSNKDPLHRATFPYSLANQLIKLYTLKGDIVLDPFAGTGTALKCAIDLERNAIGYEINLTYFENLIKEYQLKADGKFCFFNEF